MRRRAAPRLAPWGGGAHDARGEHTSAAGPPQALAPPGAARGDARGRHITRPRMRTLRGTSTSAGKPPARLDYIDTWRAVAVALVILSHLALHEGVKARFEGAGVDFMFHFGKVGVFLFFFISGFVVGK